MNLSTNIVWWGNGQPTRVQTNWDSLGVDSISADMHIPTLDTNTDNNRPYNWPYFCFALPTDLLWYWYWCALMYLQSFHITDLINTKWSNFPCQFWTSHIPLRLPNIIPMIQCDWHIDNLGISVTSTHQHTSEYLQPWLKRHFGSINSLDITDAHFNIWYWWFFSTLQCFVLYLVYVWVLQSWVGLILIPYTVYILYFS